MKTSDVHSRRNFLGLIATGAVATGFSMLPDAVKANILNPGFEDLLSPMKGSSADEMDAAIKAVGQMQHAVCYDASQAIPWSFIWTNVYYMTNEATGTSNDQLGVLTVLRHHGMVFAMNDDVIAKYKLGEFFELNDPVTKKPVLRNPYWLAEDGVFPLPGLGGIKKLQEQGATFCVCDMARKVNAMFIAKKMGADSDEVYKDLVAGTLPGIMPAPSGVWVLGRLAENQIAYIDASVG